MRVADEMADIAAEAGMLAVPSDEADKAHSMGDC